MKYNYSPEILNSLNEAWFINPFLHMKVLIENQNNGFIYKR